VGFKPTAKFALVYGSGSVVVGGGSSSPIGALRLASDTVSRAIEDAAEDDEIEAIIFRVDSPGGSPLASDIVWRAIELAKKSGKPLVASFSDVAASGGYYVACGADVIVAPGTSLVGSIGVFVMRPVLAGLFEKLDIGVDTLTRGAHADLLLSSQPLTASGRAHLHREIARTYELFKERVGAGRGLDPEAVEEVARGRVWTAAQAVELGLIDSIGGLREAANIAKERAGLGSDEDVALIPFPKPRTFVEQLSDSLQNISVQHFTPFSEFGPGMKSVSQWMIAIAQGVGSPQLLPPFLVEIR
jgi:protease-4